MKAVPSQVIAGCFAMSAFVIAIIAGLAAQNEASSVLFRAVAAMFIAYPVGLIAGSMCAGIVREHGRATLAAMEDNDEGSVSPDDIPLPTTVDVEQNVDNEEILEV